MIRIRALLSGGVGAIGLAVALGPGAPDPSVTLGARALVIERAERAERTLDALESAIDAALEEARRGAARIVGGDERPGPRLQAGAELLRAADAPSREARLAVRELNAVQRARNPSAPTVEPPTTEGEIASIAAQLEAAADAGDRFAGMRERAARVTTALERSLEGLEAGDLAVAENGARSARRHHDALVAWEVDFATLPVWIETTDAMIGAVEAIIDASRAGDAGAAEEAGRRFGALAGDGALADRALRIAVSEGGAAVASAPLGRLAAVLTAVHERRAAVSSIRRAVDG